MRSAPECGICLTHWIYGRASANLAEEERLRLLEAVVDSMFRHAGVIENLGGVSNRATDVAFAAAPQARRQYGAAKAASNRGAKGLLPAALAYVDKAKTPRERFERACSVAALANIAPLGVPTGPFAFEELQGLLDRDAPKPIFLGDAFAAAQEARRVFYAADNAGEVGMDSIVIRLLREMGAHVTLAVKEPEFFEDATEEDARCFGLEAVADRVVSADGFVVPGEAPAAVSQALDEADLVIAKGTGSFESLSGEIGHRRGIFLLKVKCGPISRQTGVPVGSFVVAVSG